MKQSCRNMLQPLHLTSIVFMVEIKQVMSLTWILKKILENNRMVETSKQTRIGITSKQWINFTIKGIKITMSFTNKTKTSIGRGQKLIRIWFNITKNWTMDKWEEFHGVPALSIKIKQQIKTLALIITKRKWTVSLITQKDEWADQCSTIKALVIS